MTDPWQRGPKPARPARVYLALALLIAIGIGVWALFRLFPEVRLSGYDQAWFVYLVAVLALISSSFLFGRQVRGGEILRNVAIWGGIAAVLILGYAYRDHFAGAATRLRGELLPSEPVTADARTLVVTETANGDYEATGAVNDTPVRFTVDTGASDIVLSPADAERAGIDVAARDYSRQTGTANGIGRAATVTLASLTLGPIRLEHIDVSVNQAPMAGSLLGMQFLGRMKSFEFKDHRLYLHWR